MAKDDATKEYRATAPLFIGRARAANVGDIITGDTLENNPAWKDKVEPVEATPQALDISRPAGEVLDWVGDDPDRATLALAAEQVKGGKARKGLIGDLEAIAAGTGPQV